MTEQTKNSPDETFNAVFIRVPSHSYIAAAFVLLFVAAFLLYIEYFAAAAVPAVIALLIVPVLSLRDGLRFDGKRISRTGILPRLWCSFTGRRSRLKIPDIETVETEAIRTFRRGGTVFYSYHTVIRGKDAAFDITSRGDAYRKFVRAVFPLVPENVMDNRSIELRDYLAERKETLTKAAFMNIPPADVLESSMFGHAAKRKRKTKMAAKPAFEAEKADDLRKLANELRLSGSFLQALEAFRRALRLNPRDGWLLFEFARCLQSFAGVEPRKGIERKAAAVMRLAERRADGDADLLARIGETYFQFGDRDRAGRVFKRALEELGENYRLLRGLAEVALRDGKIAHVIQNFYSANRSAETTALKRWTKREAEYFSRLNENDEYMEMEVSRVNLMESLERFRRSALRVSALGLPFIIFGVATGNSAAANVGWTISGVALMIWIGLVGFLRMLASRIPYELVEEDR